MPNWCYTQINFHGNKNEIMDLHSKIDRWTSQELRKSDFGASWLGNILQGAGLGYEIDRGVLRCRGSVTYLSDIDISSDEDATFGISTETAWAPNCLMWSEVIKVQGYKTIGFSYQAEECGMEVYETFDNYGDFPEKFYVDGYYEWEDKSPELDTLLDTKYYTRDDDLITNLQAFLHTQETDLTKLIDMAHSYNFKNEDSYLRINEYAFVDTVEV